MKYRIVNNFPDLGKAVAIEFLNWVQENPEGVISLPTGKTPEYFIKYTKEILENRNTPLSRDPDVYRDHAGEGLGVRRMGKLSLRGLRFVQMDDFYPINPLHHNSFNYYVKEFYIKGFGLDEKKALLIDTDEIGVTLPVEREGKEGKYGKFPDLTLRHREPTSKWEEFEKEAIFRIDNWCMNYEQRIREMGGIGFFLGGIGPDGHIAFNIKGSDHNSTTRLCDTNYETQAAAAGDLGGIEISGSRSVITIGLGTITYHPNCRAIIFAAGETKAPMVRDAIENQPDAKYPGSVLHKLPNAEFFLTAGAASLLKEVQEKKIKEGDWTVEKSIIRLLDYCQTNRVYAHKITEKEIGRLGDWGIGKTPLSREQSERGRGAGGEVDAIAEVKARLNKGLEKVTNRRILHTGPHHDDIMLGLMPLVNRQLREPTNRVSFAVATSGFTALSNRFLIDRLRHTLQLIDQGEIQMIHYPGFFESGYLYKWDKDVNHYLNKVAERDEESKLRGLSHRIVRCLVRIYKVDSIPALYEKITVLIDYLTGCYDGEKNTPDVQQLKGMIREFEEELVWAHSGIQVKDVHHLRLGFYKGDIFTEQPEEDRDVKPVLELLNRLKPNMISITMDPEGSGPDTHYKVLQTFAKALKLYDHSQADGGLKIIGYRNVWYRYHPAEANVYLPVSLNALAAMQNSFRQCYLSQVDASFPSPQLKGPFCDLAQKMWVDQFKEVQVLLGKDFFYMNERPLIRATHGLIFYRELTVEQFLLEASELARKMEK